MLKNLNDILSLVALIILTVLSLKILFGALFFNPNEKNSESKVSRRYLFKNYLDNEDD